MWWPFIDGRYLANGIDLESLFETLSADRMMNMLDTIIVEDALSGAMVDGGIEKIRTSILSIYNGRQTYGNTETGSYDPDPMASNEVKPMHRYIQPSDEGLAGFEAPLG